MRRAARSNIGTSASAERRIAALEARLERANAPSQTLIASHATLDSAQGARKARQRAKAQSTAPRTNKSTRRKTPRAPSNSELPLRNTSAPRIRSVTRVKVKSGHAFKQH